MDHVPTRAYPHKVGRGGGFEIVKDLVQSGCDDRPLCQASFDFGRGGALLRPWCGKGSVSGEWQITPVLLLRACEKMGKGTGQSCGAWSERVPFFSQALTAHFGSLR